jgi:hypothetical protein
MKQREAGGDDPENSKLDTIGRVGRVGRSVLEGWVGRYMKQLLAGSCVAVCVCVCLSPGSDETGLADGDYSLLPCHVAKTP